MHLNSYQTQVRKTAIYKTHHIIYPALGLAGEVGELINKIKKIIRDEDADFESIDSEALGQELGDCLWYVAMLAHDLGLSLQDVADLNLAKLRKRATENKLKGSGDYR